MIFARLFFLLLAGLFTLSVSPGLAEEDARKSKAFTYYQQALQYHKQGNLPEAIKLYQQASGFDPSNKIYHHYLALAMSENGDDYHAKMEFRTALNNDFNYVECRNNYAVVLRKTGEPEEAMKHFKECVRINPKYAPAYYHIGEMLQFKGDLEGAIENYQTAVNLKPDYYDAQRDLGLAMFERCNANDIADALDKLLIAAKLVPNNPMIHYHLATIYCAEAKLDQAESELRQALMYDSQLAAAHWELAKLRYFRGDLDRCIAEIKAAQKINPTYGENKKYPPLDPVVMKKSLAKALEFRGKRIEAVDTWKEVASMTKDNTLVLKHIAEMEKDLRKQAKQKQKPLPYDPEEIDALIDRGISEYEDGQLDEAKQTFDRAAQLNPQSFEALQNTGAVLEASGDLNGALVKYQAAMAVKPQYDGAYYNLAHLLEKLNLPADAGLMYQRFHEIAGKYPYDPKHIVSLQQEDARRRAKEEQLKKRGY
jgi:tetratricopeptide (TPR) repeat protein